MTKQQYIDRFFGKTIDECADLCHEHDVHVRKENIEPLQRKISELNETIESNLRVHKAAEKADAERIWKLQQDNAALRECLKEALEDKCEVCKHSWYGNCVTSDGSPCSLVAKWRATLEGVVK